MYIIFLLVLMLFALAVVLLTRCWRDVINSITDLRDFVSATEDQWAWTTEDGCLYENVEVGGIEGDEIILNHRFGTSRLVIAALSDESRQRLFRTSVWRNHDEGGAGLNAEHRIVHSQAH